MKNILSGFSENDLHNELQRRQKDIIDFNGISLKINSDSGGGVYKSNSMFSDFNDQIYIKIAEVFQSSILMVDIGANIGFCSLQMARAFPGGRLICVEPNPDLEPILKRNLIENGVDNFDLLNCIVGNSNMVSTFQVNNSYAADSRVFGLENGYSSIKVDQITIDSIIERHITQFDTDYNNLNLFIKIDTQGYEKQVFDGAKKLLESSLRFLIKMEFSPYHLSRMGTDPVFFLKMLVEKFSVTEITRSRFKGDELVNAFARKLLISDIENFNNYTKLLARDNMGWTDLLIAPKNVWF